MNGGIEVDKLEEKLEKSQAKRGPSWSEESLLALVSCWKDEINASGFSGKTAQAFHANIHKRFADVDGGIYAAGRTPKATNDKIEDLKKTYKFICDFNQSKLIGSAEMPTWFEIAPKERKELRRKFRDLWPAFTDMSVEVYNAMEEIANYDANLRAKKLLPSSAAAAAAAAAAAVSVVAGITIDADQTAKHHHQHHHLQGPSATLMPPTHSLLLHQQQQQQQRPEDDVHAMGLAPQMRKRSRSPSFSMDEVRGIIDESIAKFFDMYERVKRREFEHQERLFSPLILAAAENIKLMNKRHKQGLPTDSLI